MGVFAAAILVMLLVAVFAALSCGWGVAIAVILQVVLAGFYFALAAIFAVGMVMLSDYCKVSHVAHEGRMFDLFTH